MEIAYQVQVFICPKILQRTVVAAMRLILRPKALRHREIVMDARNGLHNLAIAMAEPLAVEGFESADVRRAKLRDWDL